MARITDLALELLILIVALYREPHSSSHKPHDIRGLSLVSKAFNDACAPFLFRYHRLILRSSQSPFDPAYAKERISVVARKSSYIRELKVQDSKTDDVDVLPDEIMPDLLAALRLVTGLTRFKLFSLSQPEEERRVPDDLWDWIKEQGSQLRYLNFYGPWLPPARGTIIDNVYRLILEPLTKGNTGLVKLIKAPNLSTSNVNLVPFKPGKDEEHLQSISMAIYGDQWAVYLKTGGYDDLLNFSGIPSAQVAVEVRSTNVGPNISKFEEWVKVRAVVNKIFADDLTTFNVHRDKREPCVAIWRFPGQQVKYQDQVDDEEADQEEWREEEEEREREQEQIRLQRARNAAAMQPRRIRYREYVG